MVPTTYVAPNEKTSPIFCRAFAKGCGGQAQVGEPLREGPMALWGSPKLWAMLTRARKEGRTWYYGDNAYFGRSELTNPTGEKFFRITKNALQHDGTGASDPSRFRQFGLPIQPWRATGHHIVICPNCAAYFELHGMRVDHWLHQVQSVIKMHTDRPVKVRWKLTAKDFPLAKDLVDAWATVVFTSNSAVESLVAGVPVFVLGETAAAYRMGQPDLTKIETPFYPNDRQAFCEALACNQWTLKEIERGMAWRQVQERAA